MTAVYWSAYHPVLARLLWVREATHRLRKTLGLISSGILPEDRPWLTLVPTRMFKHTGVRITTKGFLFGQVYGPKMISSSLARQEVDRRVGGSVSYTTQREGN